MFSGCTSGTLNTAGCLSATEAVEFANDAPIDLLGSTFSANNPFIIFAGNGTSHASIQYTVAGDGPGSSNTNCATLGPGDSCSLYPGSPIILTDAPSGNVAGTTLTFGVFGTVTDGSGTDDFSGKFTTPISGMSPFDIQKMFCPEVATGGSCSAADFANTSNSLVKPTGGDFLSSAAVTTPEVGTNTMLAMGIGLIGVSLFRRAKTNKLTKQQ